jgi:ABC-2 type transport system ATP-binding protein
MTENAGPYENLTAGQNLRFFGRLQDLPEAVISERGARLLDRFGLAAARDRKVKTYSSGMKKKISLAITLLHQPKVLFLDEPTANLDPEASRDVLNLIRQLAQEEKTTVFLCTHQLKYAEEICTLFGFLHRGRLLATGRLDELRRRQQASVTLRVRGSRLTESLGLVLENGWWSRAVAGDAEAAAIMAAISAAGGEIYEARQEQWSLEDLYFKFQKDTENGLPL